MDALEHHRPVGHIDPFRGTHESALVARRTILREALRRNAHGLIVFQSRPNGNHQISAADVAWGRQMKEDCQLVDLELNDYLVLAGGRWSSLRRTEAW